MDDAKFWARFRRRFCAQVGRRPNGCWLWRGRLDKDGYGWVWLRDGNRRAHRVAWLLEHGVEPQQHVLHTCDRPACVNPAHLYEGTQADNMRDKVRRGRTPDQSGERAPNAKLDAEAVREIRRLVGDKYKASRGHRCGLQKALAARFGVSMMTVNDVIHERTWRGV